MGKTKSNNGKYNSSSSLRKLELCDPKNGHSNIKDRCTAVSFEKWLIPTLFLTVLTTYYTSLYPSLPGGDSGELIVSSHEFGVAHPPGYPLFTMLSRVFIAIVPFGSIAWRMNLLTASFSSITTVVLYVIILKITDENGSALLGAGYFAYSRLTWYWSVSTEVFSLNNLLLSLLMVKAVDLSNCSKENKQRVCLFGAFLCGLCLSNQHTSVLYLIFLVPWALMHLIHNKLISFPILVYITCAFFLGLLPYLYLPVSSYVHKARWTWGDQRTLRGFMKHLLRQEYGTWDLLKDHTGQGFFDGLRAYSTHVLTDLSWTISGLFVLSPSTIFLRRKANSGSVLLTFFLMLILYVSFFAWRANLDIKNPLFFKVVERFWIQADLVVVIFAALSYNDVSGYLCRKVKMKRSYLDVALVVPLLTIQISKSWQYCNQSSNTVIHDFSLQALHAFPNNSIILTKGDLCSNSFRYFHLCENVRPDLHIFDQEVLTYDWSLPMMQEFYPGIKFPGSFLYLSSGLTKDGRKAFTFKDLINANFNSHRIFACIGVQDHEPSWQASYTLRPFGVCWELVKKDASLNLNTLSEEAASFTDKWHYKWTHEPDDGSWEFVANSEMWRAKTALPLFYLEISSSLLEGSDMFRELLLQSYELYTNAIEAASNIPPYWHRNYAITCERLTRANSSMSQVDLVKKTVFHFKEFVKLEPGDADASQIRKAVKTLSDYLANVDPNFR